MLYDLRDEGIVDPQKLNSTLHHICMLCFETSPFPEKKSDHSQWHLNYPESFPDNPQSLGSPQELPFGANSEILTNSTERDPHPKSAHSPEPPNHRRPPELRSGSEGAVSLASLRHAPHPGPFLPPQRPWRGWLGPLGWAHSSDWELARFPRDGGGIKRFVAPLSGVGEG